MTADKPSNSSTFPILCASVDILGVSFIAMPCIRCLASLQHRRIRDVYMGMARRCTVGRQFHLDNPFGWFENVDHGRREKRGDSSDNLPN